MIAKKLKELREKKGMSQAELADILDVAQQTVASWEKEKSSPNYGILKKLADYFHVTTDELLGRDAPKPGYCLDPEAARLASEMKENPAIEKYFRLSPDGRAKVEEYMEYIEEKEAQARVKSGWMEAGGNFAG